MIFCFLLLIMNTINTHVLLITYYNNILLILINMTSQPPSLHCVSPLWTIYFINVAEYTKFMILKDKNQENSFK